MSESTDFKLLYITGQLYNILFTLEHVIECVMQILRQSEVTISHIC